LKALVAEIHRIGGTRPIRLISSLRSLGKFQRNFFKANVFGSEPSGAGVVLRLQLSLQPV
jgi:hypothetical protein